MHLDKFNRTLIRIKPEKNINCLPIYIKDLSLILDERKILSSLNLSINSDDVTVIMGPNGAGKSIFLKILNGILIPSSGCISWNNKKLFSDTLNISGITKLESHFSVLKCPKIYSKVDINFKFYKISFFYLVPFLKVFKISQYYEFVCEKP